MGTHVEKTDIMKGLIILGLSLALGEAVKLKVDIQELHNAELSARAAEPLTGQEAPVWEFPGWEGYPCHKRMMGHDCPGFKKTKKVWDKSVGCKKLPESFNYTPLKQDHGPDGFLKFVERCQHKCMDGNHPPKCSLIETRMVNPQWICIMKSCTNATGPTWAPEPNERRAGRWLGWRRVPPGYWSRLDHEISVMPGKLPEGVHDHMSKRQLY